MSQALRKAELYASWMPRSTRWYVMAIMAGFEATAVDHLQRQGYEPYVPMVVDRDLDERGRWKETRRIRFRGYGFIPLDLDQDQWRSVNGTRGVRHLLPHHLERPLALPTGFVERLMAMPEKADEIVVEFGVDDLVRFIAGPLLTYQAMIERVDGHKLQARLPNGAIVDAVSSDVEKVEQA